VTVRMRKDCRNLTKNPKERNIAETAVDPSQIPHD
jgi:hypothetical protein